MYDWSNTALPNIDGTQNWPLKRGAISLALTVICQLPSLGKMDYPRAKGTTWNGQCLDELVRVCIIGGKYTLPHRSPPTQQQGLPRPSRTATDQRPRGSPHQHHHPSTPGIGPGPKWRPELTPATRVGGNLTDPHKSCKNGDKSVNKSTWDCLDRLACHAAAPLSYD